MGVEPYGPAIFNAIERGDAARLSRLLDTARQIHQSQGDLNKAIRAGEAALKKLKAKK
ncbi:MAG TPA: DUF1843 domain-containing protein [Thermoanaerobaculia bacterium]|jgi:hypothetical protein